MHIRTKKILSGCLLVFMTVVVASILQTGIKLRTDEMTIGSILSSFTGYTYLGENDVILQKEDNDCGPAALMNVFAHYGIESSLEEIEVVAGTSEQGASILGLKEMAEIKGLKAEGWKYTWEDFQNVTFPVIAFVQGNHYIVVESIRDERTLIVVDPAIGRLKMSRRKFGRIWSGETLQIEKADSNESALLPEGYRWVIIADEYRQHNKKRVGN